MDTFNKQKIISRIALLVTLGGMLIQHFFSLIDISHFKWLEKYISYELLLTLSGIVVIVLLHIIHSQQLKISYISSAELGGANKVENKNLERDRNSKMQNLSLAERKILKKYLENSTKSLQFIPTGILEGMVNNGILFNPYNTRVLGDPVTYNLEDWAWEYLSKHKEEF